MPSCNHGLIRCILTILLALSQSIAQQYTKTSTVTPSDTISGERFGYRTAVADTVAAVSAPYAKGTNNESQSGAVYVYTLSGTVWGYQTKLVADVTQATAYFGESLAMTSTIIVVGAPHYDIASNVRNGAVFVFTASGATWVRTAKLTMTGAVNVIRFGQSVSVSSNRLVVGVPWDLVDNFSNSGKICIYYGENSFWSSTPTCLTSPTTAADDYLGTSVAHTKVGTIDYIFGAAPQKDITGQNNQGVVYVYTFNGSWSSPQTLTASSYANEDKFGNSMSSLGSTLVVSAMMADVDFFIDAGALYVFTISSGSWTFSTRLTSGSGLAANLKLGDTVSITTNTICTSRGSTQVEFFRLNAGAWSFSSVVAGTSCGVSVSENHRVIGNTNNNQVGFVDFYTSNILVSSEYHY